MIYRLAQSGLTILSAWKYLAKTMTNAPLGRVVLPRYEKRTGKKISPILQLSDKKWLAKGKQRLVFVHPDDRRFVLKVQYNREGHISSDRHLKREKQVYDLIRNRLKSDPNPPIPKYFGTVETDMGTADIYEAFYGPKGVRLAPTLAHFFRTNQISEVRVKLLNDFIHRLDTWEIPVTDMNRRNIVFANRNGQDQFLLVDGFGDYRTLPLARWSSFVRRSRIDAACRRIVNGQYVKWDSNSRRFRF